MGTGYPCAGQVSTTLDRVLVSFQPRFISPINAGALLPMGSNETKVTQNLQRADYDTRVVNEVYLKLGTGLPCAGQNRTTVDTQALSFQPPFKSPVNVGALLPTGSIHTQQFEKVLTARRWKVKCST